MYICTHTHTHIYYIHYKNAAVIKENKLHALAKKKVDEMKESVAEDLHDRLFEKVIFTLSANGVIEREASQKGEDDKERQVEKDGERVFDLPGPEEIQGEVTNEAEVLIKS